MKNKISPFYFFITLIFLLSACNKEIKKETPIPTTTCKVSKANYYDASSNTKPKDSAVYTYTGNNITKVQTGNLYYQLEYNENTITKRNIFIYGNPTPDYYDAITYNTDGSINKIERFINTTTTYKIFYRYEFLYTTGKLTQVNYYNMAKNVAQKDADYVFTYTGNNITTAVYNDYTGTTQNSITINYTYDANANYLKKQNSNILLIDNLFIDVDAKLFPLIYSANNVLNSGQNSFSYTLDANQNLKDIMLQNKLFAHYNYLCQ